MRAESLLSDAIQFMNMQFWTVDPYWNSSKNNLLFKMLLTFLNLKSEILWRFHFSSDWPEYKLIVINLRESLRHKLLIDYNFNARLEIGYLNDLQWQLNQKEFNQSVRSGKNEPLKCMEILNKKLNGIVYIYGISYIIYTV